MKISTTFIQKYLCRTMSDSEIVQAMEQAGIEIEQFISSTPLDKNIVVGLTKKVAQHPNADRLHLVKVEGPKGIYNVVCGAPNVREGQKVALAQIGATLPDGEVIQEAKLRGELSEGMLCSARELGLGDDHSGIIELPTDTKVGTTVDSLFPVASVVDIKTHANRPDLLSAIGLAREVAAMADNELQLPDEQELVPDNGPKVKLEADEQLVPRFGLAELTLCDVKPLPREMITDLEASGIRSISSVVDITNYVMAAWGQPTHAYDADKVKGVLTVRSAVAGETLVTLDGVKRRLTKDDLVIADDDGPVGLAGVMGGQRTEVDASTKRILLESATFDAATVRRTAKRHGLRTEASARFERGLPVQLSPLAMGYAVELLIKYAEAKLNGVTDELRIWPWIQRIGLRKGYLNRLLGLELSFDEAKNSLAKLGIEAQSFDIVAEAKRHLGKPYKFGAKFRVDGTEAFDCSYLTDYLYSLIGAPIGHTAHQQFKAGRAVELDQLKVGDLLFRDGPWDKLDAESREHVSHVALYIGGGNILHASDIVRDNHGGWQKRSPAEVLIEPLGNLTNDPQFLGARRYVDDLGDFLSISAVPWWRPDIKEPADVVEEVVRAIGYDRIPARLPQWRPEGLTFDRMTPARWRLQSLLQGLGLFEVMTYSFVTAEQLAGVNQDPTTHLKLVNPLSSEQAYLRSTVLPSLLTVAERNAGYAPEFGLYEITKVFEPQSKGQLPHEPLRLAILAKTQGAAYSVIKGLVDRLMTEMGVKFEVGQVLTDANFVPGRLVDISLGQKIIGIMGELSPEISLRFKTGGSLGYAEINLKMLLAAAGPKPFQEPNRFPSVKRDLNLQLDLGVTWAQVKVAVSKTGLAEARFVNDYYGDQLPAGKKNLAVRLIMSDPTKTLTDAEAEQRLREIAGVLKKQLAAVVL